jgi:hypothetical protein
VVGVGHENIKPCASAFQKPMAAKLQPPSSCTQVPTTVDEKWAHSNAISRSRE